MFSKHCIHETIRDGEIGEDFGALCMLALFRDIDQRRVVVDAMYIRRSALGFWSQGGLDVGTLRIDYRRQSLRFSRFNL